MWAFYVGIQIYYNLEMINYINMCVYNVYIIHIDQEDICNVIASFFPTSGDVTKISVPFEFILKI